MDWFRTLKSVLLEPSKFFKKMKTSGGYKDPLSFAFVNFFLAGLFFGLISLNPISMLASLLIMPLFGLVGVFLNALLYHILLRLVGGRGNYESTARVISFSSATSIFSWIPVVSLLSSIYTLYLYTIGFSTIHKISKMKSLLVVLVPVFILSLLAILAVFYLSTNQTI